MIDGPLEPDPATLTEGELEAILRGLGGAAATTADTLPSPANVHSSSAGPALPPPDPTVAANLNADALRGLIEAVPDALVVANATGRIVLVNVQTERLFGYRRDELLGHSLELLVPEQFREKHVDKRDGYFREPHVRPMGRELELSGRRKDGHPVPVEISLSPLVTDAGTLVVASIRDVSAKREAYAQLRKMEARYRTLVEGIPAVTFMAAMEEGASEANELYVSPQIVDLLGFTQREWLDNPILWYAQLHPDDRERWHREFARTVSTGERFQSVYRFIARDGRVVWVRGDAKLVKDDDGQPLFLQGVAFDITEVKQAEENLKALNATLEKRVEARTAELARSNQALGRFAGNVAHDLLTPLGTIKKWTGILAEDLQEILDDNAKKNLTRVINAAGRAGTLVNALLTIASVQTEGKDPLPVACGVALDWARTQLEDRIQELGAEVVIAEELPMVLADETQLGLLLQNLIENALKYCSDRPPVVRLSARREGGEWLIEVSDNGVGIESSECCEKIFDVGVKSRLNKHIAGSGMGLVICTAIVQRHGGRIRASSEGLDKGTTISFTLPAVS